MTVDKRKSALEVELIVVAQSDYETVLTALRDYIRLTEGRRETYGVDHTLRLAEIRELARTARPKP